MTRERFAELWHKYCDYIFIIHKGNKLKDYCSPQLTHYLIDSANGLHTESLAKKYYVD